MESPSWTKWVVLSFYDYVKTYMATDYFWIQGTFKKANQPNDRYEIRFIGPDTHTQTADNSLLTITFNCQVVTLKVENDLEKHLKRIGKAKVMFPQCIQVYKYGSDNVNDDQTSWYMMQQISDVTVTPLGPIDPVSNVERSTVEATYKIVVEE